MRCIANSFTSGPANVTKDSRPPSSPLPLLQGPVVSQWLRLDPRVRSDLSDQCLALGWGYSDTTLEEPSPSCIATIERTDDRLVRRVRHHLKSLLHIEHSSTFTWLNLISCTISFQNYHLIGLSSRKRSMDNFVHQFGWSNHWKFSARSPAFPVNERAKAGGLLALGVTFMLVLSNEVIYIQGRTCKRSGLCYG